MTSPGTNQRPLDVTLDILANHYRRRLLIALLEHNPQDDDDTQTPVEATVEDGDLETLRVQMTHVHLPKMEDAGFIRWNREMNEVRKGPRFDEIRPLLELIHNHSDELPDGGL
ncbi:DUF7344 domain-containing protein [Halorubrum sp. HHNYT27]|uniref:DUF7344 domain-containing protein n=1 Tax=Halorubrum sp. HHNYT27 TaxID=3402275 RepID=UPI003EBD0EF0